MSLVAVTVDGERDILGLWVGDGGEGAKYWHHVLTEIKNRGTADVCIVVCDGLTGLTDAVSVVWPQAIVQTCIVHYADVRVMPTCSQRRRSARASCRSGRHNHRRHPEASRERSGDLVVDPGIVLLCDLGVSRSAIRTSVSIG